MDSSKRMPMITEKPHPYIWRFVRAQHPSPLPTAAEPGLPVFVVVVLRPLHIQVFSQLDLGNPADFISP